MAYAYDTSASSNYTRLDFMTYPNLRTLYSRYDKHSGSAGTLQDEISDGFGRMTQFSNTNSDPGDVYIQYSHIGPGRMAGRLSKSAANYKGNDRAGKGSGYI